MIRHILLPLLCLIAAHAGEFSVYLTPPELTENGTALTSVDDIHIDVNGKAIPIALTEGRQSIAYPYAAGAEIQFFRVANDQTRTLIVSTSVPAGAQQGLLVLSRGADGAYRIAPFWFSGQETKKGSAVFVNLSGRQLGLVCNEKRLKLMPESRAIVAGLFSSGQKLVPTRVEIYGQTNDGSTDLIRLIDRRVGIPSDDTGIYMILPKQENYITLLALESGGLRDPIAKEALQKQLVTQSVVAPQTPPGS